MIKQFFLDGERARFRLISILLLVVLCFSLASSGTTSQHRGAKTKPLVTTVASNQLKAQPTPRLRRGRPVKPPDPYLEFVAIASLLGVKQEANIGAAITPQDRGIHTTLFQPNLARFQLFRDATNSFNPKNSVEMHKDGTIYVAYTPTRSPTWYDTYAAVDNDQNLPVDAGANERLPFKTFKNRNVNENKWRRSLAAFRPGRGPAPHWFKISVPGAPSAPLFGSDGWLNFLATGSDEQMNKLIPHTTPTLPGSGNYCYRDTRDKWSTITLNDPPEWATILPSQYGGFGFGQRTLNPGLPYNAQTNPSLKWDDLMEIMQASPDRGLDILKWRGHPDSGDYGLATGPFASVYPGSASVSWVSSVVEGIVTNSFLSGGDYAGSRMQGPQDYYRGSPPPRQPWFPLIGCGNLNSTDSLCDDWIVYVKPDPEYRFLLARYMGDNQEQGNFNEEHQGNLENEIEQWLVPVGWRPEPGDRIYMTGRWIIDCGHDDWHAEIHPFELLVSSHLEIGGRQAAIDKAEVASSVVITGAWTGGTLEFDVWPPARPNPGATLKWTAAGRPSLSTEIRHVSQRPEPEDNPNHLHVTVDSSTSGPLIQGGLNDVYYNVTRRLLATYHLWWENPPGDTRTTITPGR